MAFSAHQATDPRVWQYSTTLTQVHTPLLENVRLGKLQVSRGLKWLLSFHQAPALSQTYGFWYSVSQKHEPALLRWQRTAAFSGKHLPVAAALRVLPVFHFSQ